MKSTTPLLLAGLLVILSGCNRSALVFKDGVAKPKSNSKDFNSQQLFQGADLYNQNCLQCHGSLDASTKRDRDAGDIKRAISAHSQMHFLKSLTATEISYIAAALNSKNVISSNRFTCIDPKTRGKGLKGHIRLSLNQLKNTLGDIFGADIVGDLKSFSSLPLDQMKKTITEFSPRYSNSHISGFLNLSLELAEKATSTSTLINRFAPACVASQISSTLSSECLTSFIETTGFKLHRRPLKSAQVVEYRNFYLDPGISSFTTREKVKSLIVRFMQAPQMLFIYNEATGSATKDGRIKVDAYTVANRLSYAVTAGPPDSSLYSLAQDGSLLTLSVVRAEAERLMTSTRGRQNINSILNLWLIGSSKEPTNNALFRTTGRAGFGDNHLPFWTWAWAVQEAQDYFEHIVYNNYNFSDLMTKDFSFPKHDYIASVMGTPVYTSGPPLQAPGGRFGILSRPAFLFNNGDRESVIKRGVLLRTRVLCDPVPPPPADLDSDVATIHTTFNVNDFNSRDVATKLTSAASCVGCHSQINPLGFALSQYGAAGEYRTVEKTYLNDGTLHRSFPVDASATSLNVINPDDAVDSFEEFAQLVGRSPKAQSCFAKYTFQTLNLRDVSSADHCALATAAKTLEDGRPVKEAIIDVVAPEDILWKGI